MKARVDVLWENPKFEKLLADTVLPEPGKFDPLLGTHPMAILAVQVRTQVYINYKAVVVSGKNIPDWPQPDIDVLENNLTTIENFLKTYNA